MPIKDLKKWLSTECPKENIKYVDPDNKKGEYIPIGLIEQDLDEFDNWNTTDFKFIMMRVDRTWMASGSVNLIVRNGEQIISRNGAVTFSVSSKSSNEDYESTALSLAIANAAKKLGKRFGRHLNGRLERGESLPVIDLDAQKKLDLAIDAINEAETIERLLELITVEYSQYEKNREFTTALSNRKQILMVKSKEQTHE